MRAIVGTLLLLLPLGCASLRTVDDGRLYRSGQLTARQLERAIADRGIQTVVNLRGPQPAARWYQAEQEVCRRTGVRMIDVVLDTTAPERGEVAALLDAYHKADSPILVHSWSRYGSVGLASGLYRASILGESNDAARKELAPWMSARWPIRSLSEHDRFLKEWQGERDFFATYQLEGREDLPDLEPERTLALRPAQQSPSLAPAPGSSLPLPAPALKWFDAGTVATHSGKSRRSAASRLGIPAEEQHGRAILPVAHRSGSSAPGEQRTIWLGAPIAVTP